MTRPVLNREDFAALVKDLCADEKSTALDLSEQLLGAVCQHQANIGVSREAWLALCDQAWRICTESEE